MHLSPLIRCNSASFFTHSEVLKTFAWFSGRVSTVQLFLLQVMSQWRRILLDKVYYLSKCHTLATPGKLYKIAWLQRFNTFTSYRNSVKATAWYILGRSRRQTLSLSVPTHVFFENNFQCLQSDNWYVQQFHFQKKEK